MALTASITPDGDSIRKPPMTGPLPAVGDGPLILTLAVDDPDVVSELRRRAEGSSRNAFAVSALRIGILALRQAQGNVDANIVRNEGLRLSRIAQSRRQ